MRKTMRALVLFLTMSNAAQLVGCGESDQPDDLGTLTSALSDVSVTGNRYRLRQATFEVLGGVDSPLSISSETYLNQDLISVGLPAGEYQVSLRPGWRLEKADGAGGAYIDVDATLTSTAVRAVTIREGQETAVVYSFRVGGDVINLGEGRLAISIEVDEPDACPQGVTVGYTGGTLPVELAGEYDEAFDCLRSEGGAAFGGVDHAHCFRKNDGSTWRIWNTGCGWEYGLKVPSMFDPSGSEWERHARSYTGQCAAMPESQRTAQALSTETFFDAFGTPLTGISSRCR
jgi:hypothetical protein